MNIARRSIHGMLTFTDTDADDNMVVRCLWSGVDSHYRGEQDFLVKSLRLIPDESNTGDIVVLSSEWINITAGKVQGYDRLRPSRPPLLVWAEGDEWINISDWFALATVSTDILRWVGEPSGVRVDFDRQAQ